MLKKIIDNKQLSIVFGYDENSLRRYFEMCLGSQVSLVLTNNSASVLSARIKDAVMCIRLHRMFLEADEGVVDEIASMLKNGRGKMVLFRTFVRDNRNKLCKKPRQKIAIKTAGKHHDLRELFDEINAEYFEGKIDAAITWGSKCSRNAVKRRTLGSYSGNINVIRINPVLDKKTVPRYFVAFVAYHEMLHAFLGTQKQGGKRIVHSQEFKKRESVFKDYERAIAWERRLSA